MGYNVFNAIAHLAMILVMLELFVVLALPLLALGGGGLFGLRLARRKLGGPVSRARAVPRRVFGLVDQGCNIAARPVIQVTSIWRGTKVALAALRRREAA